MKNKQATSIKITWQNDHTMGYWNEVCIWALEQFGLPGDRYTTRLYSTRWNITHAETEHMVFEFKNTVDAEFFALRWAS